MSGPDAGLPVVAIIGGGFTGGSVAWHLAGLLPPGSARIVVVEPRASLGGGLAYSSPDPAHRINVPAAKMSLDPDDAGHFARWLDADGALGDDPEAVIDAERAFPRRAVFGRYVASHLEPHLASGAITHVRERALAARPSGTGFRVALADGSGLDADLVVLATSHPPPARLGILADALGSDPRFIADSGIAGALDGIGADDEVLIVGTGLTMADVVASLDRTGKPRRILAISRRGQRSRGHAASPVPAFGDFSSRPSRTTRELLLDVRRTVGEAEAAGLSWHAVFDALRTQGGAIWAALPIAERRRLVRHLRPYWDTHRFRIAPQVEAVLGRRIADGSLEIAAASIASVVPGDEGIVVTFRPRHGRPPFARRFDAIAATTGPGHRSILDSEPVPASLATAGLLRADTVGLGIDVDPRGRAIDRTGRPVDALIIAGPLARGTFGELMGLPEVSNYARIVAREAAGFVAAQRSHDSRKTG